MQIALIGATASPCRFLANRLARSGHGVLCLLEPDFGIHNRSEDWDRRIDWLLGSVHDNRSIALLLDGADVVFHFAPGSDQNDIEISVIIPMRILLAAYDAGASRFIYVSPQSQFEVVFHAPTAGEHQAAELQDGEGAASRDSLRWNWDRPQ